MVELLQQYCNLTIVTMWYPSNLMGSAVFLLLAMASDSFAVGAIFFCILSQIKYINLYKIYVYCKNILYLYNYKEYVNLFVMRKKQKDVLNTARELFWKHGVSRITMEEISSKAHVSKMTLYKYYSNKKELALAVLETEIGKSMDKFRDIIKSDIAFEEKLEQMFRLKTEGTREISREFLSDIYQNPELGLHTYVAAQAQKSATLFTSFLQDSQRKGLIRQDLKIPFVVHYMNQMIQMITDRQLQKYYDNPQELIMEMMRFMFYGLLPRK